MSVRLLIIGDVVGEPGQRILRERLPALRRDAKVDFCVANVENAANGSGFTPEILDQLAEAGADAFTAGDHFYSNKRIFKTLGKEPRLLKPANLSPLSVGKGFGIYDLPGGAKVLVFCLLGRMFMKPMDCPFRCADAILEEHKSAATVRLVEFHAEATAEKVAMGWHLDGRVSAVVGTHTHVPTADDRVLPGGTAYITDVGMTGPHESVIGRRADRVLHFLTTQMPVPFDVATGDVRLNAVLITVNPKTGAAEGIERIQLAENDAADMSANQERGRG